MTNTRLTDATPAALYAHTAARQWECEKEMPSDRPESVKDITWQLVNNDPGVRPPMALVRLYRARNIFSDNTN